MTCPAASALSDISRIETEERLVRGKLGFSGAYLAVQYLFDCIRRHAGRITPKTTDALLDLIASTRFETRRQSFFLYKEAALALIHISTISSHPLAGFSIARLQSLLVRTKGKKQRAISEALGSLPVNISGPDLEPDLACRILRVKFEAVLKHCRITDAPEMKWHGRTLHIPMTDDRIGCIKFARTASDIENLFRETRWLDHLRSSPLNRQSDFHIPIPISIDTHTVFEFIALPDLIQQNPDISPEFRAIGYIAPKTYFEYPNIPHGFTDPEKEALRIFKKNARLLGLLTAQGILHTAIIPLFHNRVQQGRREDNGVYLWEHGGRLDRWLESSRFPNFAASGLRDFEHLVPLSDTKQLHHFIGEHLLGFILVAGSFFRNKDPQRTGYDAQRNPVDTRPLFDRALFINLITESCKNYYQGLTGQCPDHIEDFITEELIDALIDAMGRDEHMEEILRVQDQLRLSDDEFITFLISRGLALENCQRIVKGKEDIVLNTGPHLGGFNRPISVPELIELLFCLSSLCISDRYITENRLKAQAK